MDMFATLSLFIESFWLVLLAIVVIVVVIALAPPPKNKRSARSRFKYDPSGPWPFVKTDMLTHAEKAAFEKIRKAFPDKHVMAQVQLSQLVQVNVGHDFQQWFNRINRMSVDFVVVDQALNTVAAIEIDDVTHRDPKRMEADARKAKTLKAARIPLIRWEALNLPEPAKIRVAVLGAAARMGGAQSAPSGGTQAAGDPSVVAAGEERADAG